VDKSARKSSGGQRGSGKRGSDNQSRTNNVLESYHSALRRRIKVSHPNLYSFLGHLQQITTDQMSDVARIRNGLNVRRPKKKANMMLNDKRIKACMSRFSCGAHTRMQFLSAVSHSMGAHSADPPAQQKMEAAAATRRRKLRFQQRQRQRHQPRIRQRQIHQPKRNSARCVW